MTYKEFKEMIENKQGYSVMCEGDFCFIRNSKTNTPLALINLTKRYDNRTSTIRRNISTVLQQIEQVKAQEK